ncbi:hypothetical protein KPL71_025392 [Citrus sinensis]|uniref:Uncharacterized protein n=1 Tax=Citrus sinensis TaxID=2711 RepID=A0ACB8HT56_CITSI|nr:hypothetical protein KPL71_025392 [Citrus sinensis]
MEQNKNVYSMYTRFTDIVNTLGAIRKIFSNSKKVKKIIRSLPKEWRQKRTAIDETKDLNVLPIDDLIGSLISYEEDLAAEKGHEEKKKNIALKASKRESDEEREMDDEELAMLARRFRKFYKKNNEQRKFRGYKNKKEKKEPITCYECKKPGHIRPECPLLNKLKKKAMVATWDDSDEETSDEDKQQEMTNLALMAVGEESCDELDKVNVLSTHDKLHDTFKDLHDELMKIDNLGKFDPKSDVGIFLGYSNSSKAYRVYSKRTLVVEESMHVTFDESNPSSTEKVIVDNAEEEEQEEASNNNQEDAPHGIQEEHHEETNVEQNEDFSSCMSQEFEMSMMGELKYFLGLQIKQNEEGIFINQAKYVKDLLKRFGYDNGMAKSTHMSTTIKLDKDEKGKEVDIKTYRDVGWLNALVVEENVYPDLVKVFYSNMDCFTEKENRVITTVEGVLIEFDDSELNSILGSSDDGLEIFSPRKPPDIDDYVYIDAVKNICRRVDLSNEDCTIQFRNKCLCFQTRILLRFIQSIVLSRSGHLDEVSHMDVALIDCILRHRPVDLGYTIVRNMLSIPKMITRSLPYAPDVSASVSSPPRPPTSGDVTLQQLMDEVQTLSVRQIEFQQQQLIHGQCLLFEHFGILYPYPPPSPPSSPPE